MDYLVSVSGGSSGQAARDAQKLEAELASTDGSVWGSLRDEFGIQSSTVAAATPSSELEDSGAGVFAPSRALGLACLAAVTLLAAALM